MNDENIKEILDEIKDYSKHEYLPPCCELTNKECKQLLDYITNLQEKYEEADKLYSKTIYEYNRVLSRNEKAIEYIKEHCEIIRFEKENVDMIGKVEGIPLLNILQGEDK